MKLVTMAFPACYGFLHALLHKNLEQVGKTIVTSFMVIVTLYCITVLLDQENGKNKKTNSQKNG